MKVKLLNLSLTLITIFSIFGSYWSLSNQLKFVHILSDSMSPIINRGDVVFIKSIPTESLQVGEIAVLPDLKEHGVFYAHRIIKLSRNAIGQVIVRTKGDANPIADDWELAITSPKTPVYIWGLSLSKIFN